VVRGLEGSGLTMMEVVMTMTQQSEREIRSGRSWEPCGDWATPSIHPLRPKETKGRGAFGMMLLEEREIRVKGIRRPHHSTHQSFPACSELA